ncbi:ent-copalyl diphosphate synthase 1 isoform X2 [Cannabis sativa]|uniref:ent-copalyl diphosphate synthase 1 isoform X2 n=1 Tax=Cannabis sativa TaxID=3483 RepID=UPI0029C9F33F|nr:ent-copalyl diphosphate synthase 1 isoform X2 [Cannabis sativa]
MYLIAGISWGKSILSSCFPLFTFKSEIEFFFSSYSYLTLTIINHTTMPSLFSQSLLLPFSQNTNTLSLFHQPKLLPPDVFQSGGLPVIKWHEIVEDDIDGEEEDTKWTRSNEIEERVASIKSMLESMDEGEISISAYDTAWVALVEDIHGSGLPQFPSSLQWIATHQLSDGSWGDADIFSAHDRLINTLACVVALKSWNLYPEKCQKGMAFFNANISKLERENPEHMPIGFEVAFPSLLEIARKLNLEVPEDSPVLKVIYARRDFKLTRIPRDIMHTVPTTLLHSLEGMVGLDWEKLLKLQSQDGSFLFSPSSTAFALMETKDRNCLQYLTKAVQRFNGGVPNVYPVDLFEHLWVADRLQRLGISRFFEPQIEECIDYVFRNWTEKGIGWARNSKVEDIDDTAMGFRLLRLHGHKVSADVFQHFKKGDDFFCFRGQSTQAVTGMYNLYRASQLVFPGEKILEDAMEFSSKFLRKKQASNELLDKWIITKDLPGEVGFALEVPWNANLPRVETRFYIEQYGGQNDVWIGKTLYRMRKVNNDEYLELAKLDYNICQALHSIEWHNLLKWYRDCKLENYGVSRRNLLLAYFLSAASIFEPERADERLAWAKTAALMQAIQSHFDDQKASSEHRMAFVSAFKRSCNMPSYLITRVSNISDTDHGLLRTLMTTLSHLSLDTMMLYGRDITHHLRQAWEKWLVKWQEGGDGHYEEEAELLIQTINLSSGRTLVKALLLSNPHYEKLFSTTNKVCCKIRHFQRQRHRAKANQNGEFNRNILTPEIESDMQEVVQLVLQKSSDDINTKIKQTFLLVAKSFYYAAYCDSKTINFHIGKVIFETVD